MKEKFNNFIHSKLFIIILILVMIATTVLVGTYAWFTWSNPGDQNTLFTMSIGGVVDITFTEGNTISGTLDPVHNYYDGLSKTFEANNRAGYNVNCEVIFDVTTIDSELISEDVKYTLVVNNEIVSEGDFSSASNGNSIILSNNVVMNSGINNFNIYFYIDGNEENNFNMMNKNVSGSIVVELVNVTLVNHITNLYLNNKDNVVTNNSIEYQYASSVNLMNDRLGGITSDYDAGNIRYYGENPNNYVDIGDESLYRIIGVFKDINVVNDDGTLERQDLIKVVSAESIGQFSYDNKPSGIGSSISDDGSNDWTDARLMMMLNPGYDIYSETKPLLDDSKNIIYGYKGSLWWNGEAGFCYTGVNNRVDECSFINNGLSNESQTKIEKVVWNLGGFDSSDVYANEIYQYERGNLVCDGRPTEWKGKIALMYPSDYGYSADFNVNKDTLSSINFCWIDGVRDPEEYMWLLTPSSSDDYVVFMLSSVSGVAVDNGETWAGGFGQIIPTFYLKGNLRLLDESAIGSLEDPYVLLD